MLKKFIGGTELKIALIKMFIFEAFCLTYLSKRIVRMKSAEKGAAIYRKKPSHN